MKPSPFGFAALALTFAFAFQPESQIQKRIKEKVVDSKPVKEMGVSFKSQPVPRYSGGRSLKTNQKKISVAVEIS